MTNPFFTSDYQIDNRTESIVCDGCDWPATTGMNNGAAPFWYLCTGVWGPVQTKLGRQVELKQKL